MRNPLLIVTTLLVLAPAFTVAEPAADQVTVFVTRAVFQGDLGGIAGADGLCTTAAMNAGLSGSWTAWLSDGITDARDRIPDAEYRLVDGTTIIAGDLNDLTDGMLDAAIELDENGIPWSNSVWTGTQPDGTLYTDNLDAAETCNNWTDATNGFDGVVGNSGAVDGNWTAFGNQAPLTPQLSPCDAVRSLYCFSAAVPQACSVDADCDDGWFCNGTESCVDSACQAGTAVDCDDGVGCTGDACAEQIDSCINVPIHSRCDNGLVCDGFERCDLVLDCQAGVPIDCDDDVDCTEDTCQDDPVLCVNTPVDGNCDNGLFCDGEETCSAILDCLDGFPPCGFGDCQEQTQSCSDVGAGAVPDGDGVPGDQLVINPTETANMFEMSWDSSCNVEDTDYAIYEGVFGDFTSHVPVASPNCTTGGATSAVVTAAAGSTYYLIVPLDAAGNEGWYGAASDGTSRPASLSACGPQLVGGCSDPADLDP